MFSKHSKFSTYINVPKRLAKAYRRDRYGWDLLVLAICLKLHRGDSGFYPSVRNIMLTFHVSHAKAKRLLEGAMNDKELFNYNPYTNFLSAKAFKDRDDRRNNYSQYCLVCDCKIGDKGERIIRHQEISRQLRDNLILCPVNAQMHMDEFHTVNNPRLVGKRALTQKHLGNIAGCHQTTVSRHLRKMEQREEITITAHDPIPVRDIEHDIVFRRIPFRKTFVKFGFEWVRDANEYTINSYSLGKRFKHIYYNNEHRTGENRSHLMDGFDL